MRRWFWTTEELHARGKSDRAIRAALDRGELLGVRRGLFAVVGTPPELVRAARVGGVATSTTASRLRGIWTPPDPRLTTPPGVGLTPLDQRLQVAVPRNASRLKDPDDPRCELGTREDVVVHWADPVLLAGSRGTGLAPPLLMLEHVFRTHPVERGIAVADSAIRLRFLRRADLPALAAVLPRHLRRGVLAATGHADSGIESIARYRLGLLDLSIEVLTTLSRVGTVDLLVDGWLIVELDGREFHEREQFERDRHRDLEATTARYRTLRFSWRQVIFDWPAVEGAVLAALAVR